MRERLTLSHVGAQGDGVAEGPGGPVFVPLTLPGEVVEGEVRDGRMADFDLISASDQRQAAPCPHFGVCGGCALQHWRDAPLLDWKAGQVRRSLARQGLEPPIHPTVAVPAGRRRRMAVHARKGADGQVQAGGRFGMIQEGRRQGRQPG